MTWNKRPCGRLIIESKWNPPVGVALWLGIWVWLSMPSLLLSRLTFLWPEHSAQLNSEAHCLPSRMAPLQLSPRSAVYFCSVSQQTPEKTSMFSEDFTDRSVSDLLGLSSYNMLWGSLLRVRHQKFWCKIALGISCYRLLILPSIGDEKLNF